MAHLACYSIISLCSSNPSKSGENLTEDPGQTVTPAVRYKNLFGCVHNTMKTSVCIKMNKTVHHYNLTSTSTMSKGFR